MWTKRESEPIKTYSRKYEARKSSAEVTVMVQDLLSVEIKMDIVCWIPFLPPNNDEVRTAVATHTTHKAAGADGLPTELFQTCVDDS